MIILLITNSININCDSYMDCITRVDFFTLFIKKNLQLFPGVTLKTKKCYDCFSNNSKSINRILGNDTIPDHVIYINDKGFNSSLDVDKLKKITKCSVSSFTRCNKYYKGEDHIFTYIKYNKRKNEFYLEIPIDKTIYKPKKLSNTIYFLLQDSSNIEEIKQILKQIDKLILTNKGISFKIGLLSLDRVKIINSKMQILEDNKFKKYIDFIEELAKTNFYFITNQNFDYYTLYELTAMDVLIISKRKYILPYRLSNLHIYFYQQTIEWDKVFNSVNDKTNVNNILNNSRQWEGVVARILSVLEMYDTNNKVREVNVDNHPKYYLNIKNKKKPLSIQYNNHSSLPKTLKDITKGDKKVNLSTKTYIQKV